MSPSVVLSDLTGKMEQHAVLYFPSTTDTTMEPNRPDYNSMRVFGSRTAVMVSALTETIINDQGQGQRKYTLSRS